MLCNFMKEYPWLKVDDTEKSGTWTNCWLGDLETGWLIAFGKDLVEELDKAIKEDGCEDTFGFDQIKEKYAALRLYAHGYLHGGKVEEVLHKYEELSKYICGNCGEPATKITRGWLYPVCDKCAKEINGEHSSIENFYDFDTYEDVLKEIDNIKENYNYEDYWSAK